MALAMRLTKDPTDIADTVALAAMLIAILAILWARIELYGTGDIENALVGEPSRTTLAACGEQQDAVVRNRWIVGFSQ